MPAVIIGLFLVLAAVFLLTPPRVEIPMREPNLVDASAVRPAPPRDAMLSDPPQVMIGGFDRTCMDCHRLLSPPPRPRRPLTQHSDLVLDHGMNDLCYNCHHRTDRNFLVSHTDEKISFAESELLCAKCHGPTFRDWKRRAHGRTNGYWNDELGPRVNLTCVQCHDPHAPAFPAYEPLPAPATLRMGDAGHDAEGHGEDLLNPLRKWKPEEPWPHEPIHMGEEPDATGNNAEYEGEDH